MIRRALLAAMLASPLAAQVVLSAGDHALRLDTLLRAHPEGLVLTVPGRQAPRLGAALSDLLSQDALLPLQLATQELEPTLPAAQELQRLAGWDGTRSRWACLDATGRIRFEGTDLPTPAAFAESYRRSGLKSRQELLEAFLLEHPDHTEAQARLLLVLRETGDQRTERAVKARPEGAKDLTDAEDEAIWEDYARRYATLLGSGAWLDVETGGSGPVALAAALPDGAARSPRLRDLARRLLPGVEADIRRAPTSARRWRVWNSLREAAGDGRPSQVLDGMEPPPGLAVWPPEAALEAYADDAGRSGDWRGVEALLSAWWERNEAFLRELTEATRREAKSGSTQVVLGSAAGFAGWTGEVALLVEAKLRLHKSGEAGTLVRTVDARMPRKGIYRRAADVARRCGEAALADTWEQMAQGR